MLPVQKDRAGSCSLGYEWTYDGEIVDVEDQHAAQLLAIPDGGFHIVFPPEPEPEPEPVAPVPEAAKAPAPVESDGQAATQPVPADIPAAARATKPATSLRGKGAKADAAAEPTA